MRKRLKKKEKPQLNDVYKIRKPLKKFVETPQKKETPQLNEVLSFFQKRKRLKKNRNKIKL